MGRKKCCEDKFEKDDLFIYGMNQNSNDFLLKRLMKGGYIEENSGTNTLLGGELTKENIDSIISKMKKQLKEDELEDSSIIMEYLKQKEPKLTKFDRMMVRYLLLKTKNERTKFMNDFLQANSIKNEIKSLSLDTDIETRNLVRSQSLQWNSTSAGVGQVVLNRGNDSDSIMKSLSFGTKYNTLYIILQAMFLTKIEIFDDMFLESDLISVVNYKSADKDLSDLPSKDTAVLDNLFRNDIALKPDVKKPLLFVIRVLSMIKKIVYEMRTTKAVYPSQETIDLLKALDLELEMIDIIPTTSYVVNAYSRLSKVVGLFPIIAIVEKKKKASVEHYNVIRYNSDYLNSSLKQDVNEIINKYFKDETCIKTQRENIFRDIAEKEYLLSYMGKSNIKDIVKVEGVIPAYSIRTTLSSNLDLCSPDFSCSLIDDYSISKTVVTASQTSVLTSAVCYEEQMDLNNGNKIYSDLSVFPLINLGNGSWLSYSKKTIYDRIRERNAEMNNLSSTLSANNLVDIAGTNEKINDLSKLMAMFVQNGANVKDASTFIISDAQAMDIINNRSLLLFYKDTQYQPQINYGLTCIF